MSNRALVNNPVEADQARSAFEPGKPLLTKRIQYHRYGGLEELRLGAAALPAPGPGQFRVRVKAAANPMDWKIRQGGLKTLTGRRFPRGLGHDFAGVVEAVGPNVTRFKVGDEVFGATGLEEAGTFAAARVAEEKTTFLKPATLSFEQAAALPIASATAWTALVSKARLRAGQQVLITGCLGSVGRVAVQIARRRGAEVVGSCSAAGFDEARALGAQEVVDYRVFNPDDYRGRFDAVYDVQGKFPIRQCGAMLKRGGVALHNVPKLWHMLWSLLSPRHKIVFAQLTPQSMAGISEAATQGKLPPRIGQNVGLSEAIPALVELEKPACPKGS